MISSRSNHFISPSYLSRLQTLFLSFQRLNHTLTQDVGKPRLTEEVELDSTSNSSTSNNEVCFDMSSWRVVDRRYHKIDRTKLSLSARAALSVLRSKGFEAYLVGGCVRDLLLNRVPKDFDVITSANLTEIKKLFFRSRVVGKRFPICHVYLKGSMIEVSSFDTVAKDTEGEETILVPQVPTGCKKIDFIRWKNCVRRDFTINSLMYDPSANKIYDYTNGLRDLKMCKVQTVIPAHLSFKEDCARILRGLRIVARLGLSFSEETAAAIQCLYMSTLDLNTQRLMLEMDYMFSYGAAESSLRLLKRFKILNHVLPFHAAYLSKQGHDQTAWNSSFLIKLFSSLDKLIACDRPCTPSLWIGILAFHLALVNNPQDALVIWTFSSMLYHGSWREAFELAREKSNVHVNFSPEISESCCTKSDEALKEAVKDFAMQVISSIDTLTEPQSDSDVVFISKQKGQAVAKLFERMLTNVKANRHRVKTTEIDYKLLKESHSHETRSVLGKIIMDTLSSGVVQNPRLEGYHVPSPILEIQPNAIKVENNCATSSHNEQQPVLEKVEFFEETVCSDISKKCPENKLSTNLSHDHIRKKNERQIRRKTEQQQQVAGNSVPKLELAEKEKNCLISSRSVGQQNMIKDSNTRKWLGEFGKSNQSLPISRTKENLTKDDEHHQSESNKEQLHELKKHQKLSSLFM